MWIVKVKVRQAHYQWLDLDENADKWYGEENRFTASERQILITQWVGEAYKALLEAKYAKFRQKTFERTGCLLTADGSRDHLVQPEGLPDYRVSPSAIIEPSTQYAVSSNPEGVTGEKDDKSQQHYIESDDEENDMVVEPVACDDGNIFYIFNVGN